MQRIEVITGEQKRRRYTPEEKARFVALAMQPGYTVSLVARQYGITPSLLFKWKRLMNDGGKSAIAAGDEVVSVSEVKALEKKVKLNRPGFPGECFVCELRLPEPGSRLMHNTLFPLQPGGYDRAAPSACDCCTSPPMPA